MQMFAKVNTFQSIHVTANPGIQDSQLGMGILLFLMEMITIEKLSHTLMRGGLDDVLLSL